MGITHIRDVDGEFGVFWRKQIMLDLDIDTIHISTNNLRTF